MQFFNDISCSWVNDLGPRNNIKILLSNLDCEWLIVGAGYTRATGKISMVIA